MRWPIFAEVCSGPGASVAPPLIVAFDRGGDPGLGVVIECRHNPIMQVI